MMPFFILIILALLVWLLIRSIQARDQIEELGSRLTQVQQELGRLKVEQKAGSAPPPAPTPALPRSLPEVVPAPVVTAETILPVPPPLPRPAPPLEPAPIRVPRPLAPASIHPPVAGLRPRPPARPAINWESFLGVKLFAWVGGLALFLGVAFFVKFSFEHNWISPQLRVSMGYLLGAGLIAGGLCVPRARHAVTAQTLCATGTLILYANIFASHAYYRFFAQPPAFALMALVTAGAFFLAIKLEAQVVAVLGLLGGFLTPPLLSTGVDKPLELFCYLGLLDAGLLSIALRKRWNHLTLLAAAATALMQAGWVWRFFVPEKIYVALGIFFGFTALFAGGFVLAHRRGNTEKWISAAGLLMPSMALGFVFYLLAAPYPELARRPGLIFSFVFAVDLAFLLMAWLRDDLRLAGFGAGAVVFLLLLRWTAGFLTTEHLNAALAFYLVFAGLHSIWPVVLQRARPGAMTPGWIHLYPVLGIVLVLVPLFKLESGVSFLVWPVVLMLDALAIGLAIITSSLISILIVFLLTVVATALWIFQLPATLPELSGMLLVIGGFAVFFMAGGIFAARKLCAQPGAPASSSGLGTGLRPEVFSQLISLAASLPFLLLMVVVVRLPLENPAPVFGLAAVLLILLLGLLRFYEIDFLAVVGLVSLLVLEWAWHFSRFSPAHVWIAVAWHGAFSMAFFAFPFMFEKRFENRVLPWTVSALALPLHFFIIYRALWQAFPGFGYFGLLPAVMAVPGILGLLGLNARGPSEERPHQARLALFGGAALFFITLIFPIQFERQWLTISWALEGLCLLWFFHGVPHPGLRWTGVGLLVVSFARLALNPWVITAYGRSGHPILNWYLYAYGIVAVCLLAGAKALKPPRDRLGGLHAPALLYTMGTVLAFLLVNIEIADSFSDAGAGLTFNFSGNLGQDMTYSLAWGVFAFALLSAGFKVVNRPTRYAGMALLVATLCKLFLHDLWRLGGLYRIGSLLGLAVLLILVSFFYQRFLSSGLKATR